MQDAHLEYDKINLYLIDPDLNTRQSCKNILYNNGFRDVNVGSTLERIDEVLKKYIPDLLICSCDLPDGDFIDYVTKIRRGEVGNNPFIPIIILVDLPTPQIVARIIESGTDGVITKPISTAQLLDRISDLISSRKNFIVSDKYIGPVRRKDTAKGILVPNTLKAKATGEKLDFAALENSINASLQEMKRLREDVIGHHIAAFVTSLVPMLERSGKLDPAIRNELLGLLEITDGAEAQLKGGKFEHVLELCDAVGNVSSLILATRGGMPDPKQIKLLKPLSQAIQACFSGAITDAVQVHAIVKQIGG